MDILDLPKKFHNRIYVAPTGCWISLYHKNSNKSGYTQVKRGDKDVLTHRFVYEYFVGKIPDGLFACHKCDVRACCNPNHIFLGTNHDNMLDAKLKKRIKSKLSESAVISIRDEYKRGATGMRALAKKYNITFSNVELIVNRKTWKHVPDVANLTQSPR